MITWLQMHPQANRDHLGFIAGFFDPEDERTAPEQVNDNYCDIWHPQAGFQLGGDAEFRRPSTLKLYYDGDPPLVPLWAAPFRNQLIVVYEYGYTAIFDPDLGFEVSRLD